VDGRGCQGSSPLGGGYKWWEMVGNGGKWLEMVKIGEKW